MQPLSTPIPEPSSDAYLINDKKPGVQIMDSKESDVESLPIRKTNLQSVMQDLDRVDRYLARALETTVAMAAGKEGEVPDKLATAVDSLAVAAEKSLAAGGGISEVQSIVESMG